MRDMLPKTLELLAAAAGFGLPDPLPLEPMTLLVDWFQQARRDKYVPNPNAMALATVGASGGPSVRVVLCKQIEPARGAVVFFTNYQSRKGDELATNPRAACVFHWDHRERQARIEGRVERVDESESDEYFATRPLLSRLGVWASDQSRPLDRRVDLIHKVQATLDRFSIAWPEVVAGRSGKPIPRPPHWGGYRLFADRVELWQGVPGRLHDRGVWERLPGNPGLLAWRTQRLQP